MNLPFTLAPVGDCAHTLLPDGLELTAQARTDLFVDPAGDGSDLPDAGRLVGTPPPGDFTFSAHVTVDFTTTYDAGVLLLHVSDRQWAKLCFEYSPQHKPTAVTVVTKDFSDDANAFTVEGNSLHLRITRTGRAWAFHASTDGAWWHLLRLFSLDGDVSLGFLAQSPLGQGCRAVFREIAFTPGAPTDLRNGT